MLTAYLFREDKEYEFDLPLMGDLAQSYGCYYLHGDFYKLKVKGSEEVLVVFSYKEQISDAIIEHAQGYLVTVIDTDKLFAWAETVSEVFGAEVRNQINPLVDKLVYTDTYEKVYLQYILQYEVSMRNERPNDK